MSAVPVPPPRLFADRGAQGLILLLGPFVYLCRFVQDDAFISFRYAANWVAGHGPVFNPGERVEGYTNFLWTAFLTLPHGLGIDPVQFVYVSGLITFCLGLAATYHLAGAWFGSVAVARISVLLLGTNYSFIAWATGGLESSLHAWLITVSLATCVAATGAGWTVGRAVAFSLSLGLAILTRLDSVVLLVLPGLAALWGALRLRSRRLPVTLGLILPALLIVLSWLSWKVSFYGELLPNTYWVKLGGRSLTRNGLVYLATFTVTYLLLPGAFAVLARWRTLVRRVGPVKLVATAGPLILWLLYVLRAGGDFMEFRFMMPVLPVIMIFLAWVVVEVLRTPISRRIGIGLLVAASAVHGLTFEYSPLRRPWIESVQGMTRWLESPQYGWVGIGRSLGETLDEARIAVTPAGAIPYYSGLETVDMLGLNDRWVAKHGASLGSRPAHRRIATLEYLMQRQVHLVLGHPQSLERLPAADEPMPRETIHLLRLLPDPQVLPPTARFVVAPWGRSAGIGMLYITPHPEIDALIDDRTWSAFAISATSR